MHFKLKIQYVISIHLMRWLTNFDDFRFKWTATAAIGIHPTKAWLSQLVNFKMQSGREEERYVIKFCFKLGKNAIRWKLDLLLLSRDQEQSGIMLALPYTRRQSKSTHKLSMIPFFDRTDMIYWTDGQQGILCWDFKGVQGENLDVRTL